MNLAETVFVVDDDPAICESLMFLGRMNQLSVETFCSAQAFLDGYNRDRPGCLVLDVKMPGMSGLELLGRLEEENVSLPVIMFTAHGDVPMAVSAMQSGAVEFVQKPFNGDELIEQIRNALERDAGNRQLNAQRREIGALLKTLTPRENEVLEHIVQGDPTKNIARKLHTSHNTVRNQRSGILKKMKAECAVDLVRMVMLYRTGKTPWSKTEETSAKT